MDPNELKDNNPTATREVFDSIPVPEPQSEPEPTRDDEGEEPQPQVEEPTESDEPVQGDENPRSAKSRIQEQSQQINQYKETLDDLLGLNQLGNPMLPKLDLQPGQEVSAEQLDEITSRKATAIVDFKLAAERNANRIKDELRESINDYPELNSKRKDDFDSELSESVSEATKAFIRANPAGNVKKFVDSMMKPYRKSVDRQVASQQQTTAKQVAQTALRPTQVTKGEKPFSELSLEEMEKKLGKVY